MTKQTARKEYVCDTCKRTIKPGEEYYKHSFNFSNHTMVRCIDHPFKPSDLTQSEYLKTIYQIQENNNIDASEFDTVEDIIEVRDEIQSELESLRDETQDKLDNMPDSLRDSPNGELLQERIDNLDNAISELSDIDDSLDNEPDREDYDDDESYEEDLAEQVHDKISDIADKINEVVSGLE